MNRAPIDFYEPSNSNGAAHREAWTTGPPPGRFEDAEAPSGVETAPPRDPITTIGVTEIAAPLPPITWLVEGLKLAPGAACAVAGYGFGGKTIAMQAMALAVASGSRLFDVFSVGKGRVLHLDYEQGQRLTCERYQRLARGSGVELAEMGDTLRLGCMPSVYLDAAEAPDVYARAMEGFSLVVVDSLRAAAPSADENSSEIRRYIDVLTRAGEKTGALPIFIHHARKPTADAPGGSKMSIRGSSAIFDACASIFVLEAEKGQATRVRHEKERITGVPVADFGLQVEDVEIGGDARAGLRVVHLEAEQLAAAQHISSSKFEALKGAIITAVTEAGELPSLNAICARVAGGNKSTKTEAVRELLEEGRLAQLGGERSPFRVGAK